MNDLLNEYETIQYLLENPNTHIQDTCFAYIPMRFSGLGIAERTDAEGKTRLVNRSKEKFCSDDFMKLYANIPICATHPVDDKGEHIPLGFNNSDLIIGNAIHAFLRENEIWIIARIHNADALEVILNSEVSTSPYFISKETENVLENGDTIYDEIPIICNHLAIVSNGFWDKKARFNSISKEEQSMSENEKVDNAEVKADTEAEVTQADTESTPTPQADSSETETKADNAESEVKADTEAEVKADSSIQALYDEINSLRAEVDSLKQASDSALCDSELQEKESVIEAINEIADSSEFVDKVYPRVSDSATSLLQKFLKVNKKHVSEKYHALVDSMPQSAYALAKNDILQDLRDNLKNKEVKAQSAALNQEKGWLSNSQGEILGYKF